MNSGSINGTSNIKKIACDVCEKNFKYKSHLIVHKRIHSGGKSYNCEVCDKGFAVKSNLSQHMVVHSGKKYFQCYVCHRN